MHVIHAILLLLRLHWIALLEAIASVLSSHSIGVSLLLQVQISSLSFFEHANSCTLWMDAADKSGEHLAAPSTKVARPCNENCPLLSTCVNHIAAHEAGIAMPHCQPHIVQVSCERPLLKP
jgi:hypothetical protein